MSSNKVSFTEEEGEEGTGFKYKCSNHKYYSNDRAEYEAHLMDASLSHIEQISNGKCFYCGGRLDADSNEGVEHRHFANGMATHKNCRYKMYQEIVNTNKNKE